ncbi:ABC transporter substrate-binding protein [Acetobacter fallax]|uniref:ABC transporter substrate-binding protein n=1 Tax=Acetobacter fallax TaxID=1737473 RepID=A0ABX0K6V2_9PROT|nr:ABC transporter substrate-binding protein [Acetobacter fallax]NHO31640.1 ABC transporter substrate-binding protein [Acetobacter fallax]NHO35199.1 ABC transporter substrate-binding protein [Acetobacter fallax]
MILRAALLAGVIFSITLTPVLAASDDAVARAGIPAGPHVGGTLRLTAQSSGGTLDPQISYLHPNYQIEAVVYDGLTTFAKTPGSLDRQAVPDLADSLPVPEDGGLTYRFHLRSDIRFSNGKLLTPDDVVASMRRLFKVNSPTAGPYYSHIVGGAACLHDPEHCTLTGGVEADDRSGTVIFHLTHPDSEFFDRLAFLHAAIVPADTPAQDTGNSAPPGTGPYYIISYDPNSAMELRRNPWFHEWNHEAQPAGYPDAIHYAYGLDPEAEVTAIENGQFDWMAENAPLDRLAEIGGRFAGQVRIIDFLNLYYAALNVNIPPFNDLRVRRAFNYAVNRKALVIHNGGPTVAIPSCQMLPSGAPGFEPGCAYTRGAAPENPAPTWSAPDMALARRLVEESGTKGQHVTIISPAQPNYVAQANELRSTLAEMGYVVSVRVITQAVQFSYIQNSDHRVQVGLTGWNADYPAASTYLQALFSCATFTPHSDNSINISGFCDHKLDALMDHAALVSITDPKAGNALWAEASRALMAQAPAVPLDQVRWVTLLSSRVHGDFVTPIYEVAFSQFQLR